MKRLILFALIIITAYACNKTNNVGDYYKIKRNGKFGFIDSLGNEIIKPQYLYASNFTKDGVALVIIDTFHKKQDTISYKDNDTTYNKMAELLNKKDDEYLYIRYGYINSKNKMQLNTIAKLFIPNTSINGDKEIKEFMNNQSFYSSFAVIQDSVTLLKGYVDLNGKIVIPCQYEDAKRFSEGVAAVRYPYFFREYGIDSTNVAKSKFDKNKSGKWGYIATDGSVVCDFKYSFNLTNLAAGRAFATIFYSDTATINNIEGTIKKKISKFQTWQSFLVDAKGNIIDKQISSYQYSDFSKDDSISTASPNRFGEMLGLGCQFIDRDGNEIKPLAGLSDSAMKRLSKDPTVLGVLSDNFYIEAASGFFEGFAVIKNGERWFFIDKYLLVRGRENMQNFQDAFPFSYGLAAVKINDKWGYIDKNFNIAIECKYDSCGYAGKNLCPIYNSTSGGIKIMSYVNRKNEVVWQNTEYNNAFEY